MRHTRIPVTALDRLNGLSPEAKAAYFALLTGQHRTSAPGLFRSGAASLAETCETTPERFAACVAELEARRLVVTDFARRVVFLPHAVEDDPPSNRDVVRSWRKVLDEIPPCDVKALAVKVLREKAGPFATDAESGAEILGLDTVPRTVSDTVRAGCAEGVALQSPSQSPTPTQSPTPKRATEPPSRSTATDGARALFERLREEAGGDEFFQQFMEDESTRVARELMAERPAVFENVSVEDLLQLYNGTTLRGTNHDRKALLLWARDPEGFMGSGAP